MNLTPRPLKKVLFFGKRMSRTRATGGLVEALRGEGLQVKWLNKATLRRWLGWDRADRFMRRAFERYRPDLVFGFCRDLPFPLLQEFSQTTPTVIWAEEPLEFITRDYHEYFACAHAVFMTNPSNVSALREQGLHHVSFLLEGFSPTFHRPAKPRGGRHDVVFIGGPGQRGQRAAFLAELSRHFDVAVYGAHWEEWSHQYPELRILGSVKPKRYRELCASSKIVLGLNQINEHSLYFSNRTFLTLGCRGFHLTHYVPGLEQVFDDGVHLAWYSDLDECSRKIEHYLATPVERQRIASAGHELVVAEHSYASRVRSILKTVRDGHTSFTAVPSGLPSIVRVRQPAVQSASGE